MDSIEIPTAIKTLSLGNNLNDGGAAVYVDNNSVGRLIVQYIPELIELEQGEPGDFAEYINVNVGRGPIGESLRVGLSQLENVTKEQILIDSSGLNRIKLLPLMVGAKSVVTVQGDFPGYSLAASIKGISHHEIPCQIGAKTLSPQVVADVVTNLDSPVVFLSMPIINPGQTAINLEIAKAILKANDTAIIVIDAAYKRAVKNSEDYVRFALNNPRVVYLNVAAKDLGACGARICWMIATPELLNRIKSGICPYPVPTQAARFISRLSLRSDLIARIHEVQAEAKEIYREWLAVSGLRYIDGDGPWVLIYLGVYCSKIVEQLINDHQIFTQDQSNKVSNLDGWIRISSSVPCQAKKVVKAMREIIGGSEAISLLN